MNMEPQVLGSSPFLVVSVSRMDDETFSNHLIIWWGLLRLTSIKVKIGWLLKNIIIYRCAIMDKTYNGVLCIFSSFILFQNCSVY